jgi:hypothetical protein
MTNANDEGRVSVVYERATPAEGRFLAMLRALAPAQMMSGDLRSPAAARDGSGGLREITATERAIDRGDGARARTAHARLSRVPWGDDRAALVWLVTYAHAGDLATLAALCGRDLAPPELRVPLQVAELRLAAIERQLAADVKALAEAAPRNTRRPSREADALRVLVRGRTEQRDALALRVTATTAAITEWGVAAMGRALDAWERTDADDACAA